ncbi:MAG: DUF2017 family protein [Chthoniobacterales bacterium]|nr:DUF2017 family protein [Chthoniobacterales bacterium]
MRFLRTDTGVVELREMHPFFAGLVAELPRVAARHEKAQSRLYPDPAGDGADQELRRDWEEHVRPGLEKLFAASREIVAGDVASMRPDQEDNRLVIPRDHIDAWLNALNQARLAIVEENGFVEADLDHREPPDLGTPRGLLLLKVHFYAHLQELLVEAIG